MSLVIQNAVVLTVAAQVLVVAPVFALAQMKGKPYSLEQIKMLVQGRVDPMRLRSLVEKDCLGFPLDNGHRSLLRVAGATDAHFAVLANACVQLPQPESLPEPEAPQEPGDPPGADDSPKPTAFFLGAGYLVDAHSDGIFHGPAFELGFFHGLGFRFRYQHVLADSVLTQSGGTGSLDVLVGPIPGFYFFCGAHLSVLSSGDSRSNKAMGGVSAGVGLSWALSHFMAFGVEAAYRVRNSSSGTATQEGVQGNMFFRLLL